MKKIKAKWLKADKYLRDIYKTSDVLKVEYEDAFFHLFTEKRALTYLGTKDLDGSDATRYQYAFRISKPLLVDYSFKKDSTEIISVLGEAGSKTLKVWEGPELSEESLHSILLTLAKDSDNYVTVDESKAMRDLDDILDELLRRPIG